MNANSILHLFRLRIIVLALFYALLSGISYYLAFQLRFDFDVPEPFTLDMINTIWWVVGLKLTLLLAFGQIDCVLEYFRLPDAMQLFASLFIGSALLAILWYSYSGIGVSPRAVILTDLLISFVLIAGFRVIMRIRASSSLSDWLNWDNIQNVIIVGAGEAGAGICYELKSKTRFGMRPVALLDDDKKKIGKYVHGVLVAGSVDQLAAVAKRYLARKVIIAFPSAPARQIREVVEMARALKIPVESVPAMADLVNGRAKITQLHSVEMEDLLGRKKIELNSSQIQSMLQGKRVMITGAGGSIGRELVSQVLTYLPDALLCVDQAEIAIFNLQQEILSFSDNRKIAQTLVLDICQHDELENALARFKPEIIFHAAAHKHVNLMEPQPSEALRNNFFATIQLLALASSFAVERFIFISTDKAINPSNVMGASKRLAELALLEQQKTSNNKTRFMAVRFGNVLGSSGSVIEIFKRQIADGGPLTVTDPEVTRFFMTVREAVGLVLQSATQGEGGEIFVLDMGEPVKIINVARQMIALNGYEEGKDIEIQITGLKPGEKAYEEVQHLSETLKPTNHPRVMRFVAKEPYATSIDSIRKDLESAIREGDTLQIKKMILKHVPEYTPYLSETP